MDVAQDPDISKTESWDLNPLSILASRAVPNRLPKHPDSQTEKRFPPKAGVPELFMDIS